MARLITTLLCISALLISCESQPSVPQDVKDNIKERVDKGIHPAVVVGVVEGDKTYYYSYGVKELTKKEPADEQSVFEIGSISKTFTGILLADMVIKGKMKLDDPIQNHLPDSVTAPTRNGAPIRMVNLSNHTSSLPRMPDNFTPANPANPYVDYSEKQLYDFLTGYHLTRDIGSEYEYSNYAAGLLGLILATKNGSPYEALMVGVIAKPLGMQSTRVTLTDSMKAHLAMGHAERKQVENWDIISLAGAGGIRSTTVDMVNYIRANMGTLKSDLYPAMQLSHKNTRAEGAVPKVGLGWHTTDADRLEIIWHNGGTGGYRTFAGFIRGGNKGVVVMTNSNMSVDDIGMHLLNPKVPLTVPDTSHIKEIAVDAKILESYVGKYELNPDFVITIALDGNQLSAQGTRQPQVPIFAKAENVFFAKDFQVQLTFNRTADGNIQSLTLLQNGKETTAKKMVE